MSMKKFVSVLGLFSALVFGLVGVSTLVPVSAADSVFSVSLPGGVSATKVDDASIRNTLINIANIIVGLVVIVSVFFIIWGAIQWMNEGAEKGQKTVVNAVIGLIIAVLAFFIISLTTGTATFLQGLVK
jgi:membrane associated rhomboid family serine protease